MRGYLVYGEGEEYSLAVVAPNAKEAKKLAWGHEMLADIDWIDVRVRWVKDAQVDNLDVGILESPVEGLRRDFFGFVEYEDCPLCGQEGMLSKVNGEVMCCNCEDDIEEGV